MKITRIRNKKTMQKLNIILKRKNYVFLLINILLTLQNKHLTIQVYFLYFQKTSATP